MNNLGYWLDQYDKQGMGKSLHDSMATRYNRPEIRAQWAADMASKEGPRQPDVYDISQQGIAHGNALRGMMMASRPDQDYDPGPISGMRMPEGEIPRGYDHMGEEARRLRLARMSQPDPDDGFRNQLLALLRGA